MVQTRQRFGQARREAAVATAPTTFRDSADCLTVRGLRCRSTPVSCVRPEAAALPAAVEGAEGVPPGRPPPATRRVRATEAVRLCVKMNADSRDKPACRNWPILATAAWVHPRKARGRAQRRRPFRVPVHLRPRPRRASPRRRRPVRSRPLPASRRAPAFPRPAR